MKLGQIQKSANTKIRTFLSPYCKYGGRSLSTSQSSPNLLSLQNQKTYIDFKKINRQKVEKNDKNNRIKLQDFQKKQNKKENRLLKCTMNRYKQKQRQKQRETVHANQSNQQYSDVLVLVKQLKDKIISLQTENRILKQNQQKDMRKIDKQNQIIKNLQEALLLARGHSSYSVGGIYINKSLKEGSSSAGYRKNEIQHPTISIAALELKINQLKQQNSKLVEINKNLIEQMDKLSKYHQDQKEHCMGRNKHKTRNLLQLQKLLNQVQMQKQRQLKQIDSLLFTV